MSGTEATLYEVAGGAAWITLNRPENRNALSAVLVNELNEHLITANNDPDVRSIVITGSDPAFCAGADLKSPPGEAIDGGGKSVPYPDVLTRILDSQKPVIVAAISGTRNWQAIPLWGAEFLGWNVRWIPGYRGVGQMSKALRQGEIDMFATNNAFTIKQLQDDGVIKLISQVGQVLGGKISRRLSYKDVPVFTEMLESAGKCPKVQKVPESDGKCYFSIEKMKSVIFQSKKRKVSFPLTKS